MKIQWPVLPLLLLLIGCSNNNTNGNLLNLDSIKQEFIQSILQENVNESPFNLDYSLRTIFFSKDLVSLFGEIVVYDHLPHGWGRYEGATFCKTEGQFHKITLEDLFQTPEQREFLRSYCESDLKTKYGRLTYLIGEDAFYSSLPQKHINTFVVNDRFLIIIFQPYSVGGCSDGPFVVTIPYEQLEDHWAPTNPLRHLIPKIASSKDYTSSRIP